MPAGRAKLSDDLLDALATLSLQGTSSRHNKTERPNKHTDRVAWNAHFEREITLKYSSFSYDLVALEDRPDAEWAWKTLDIGHINQTIARGMKELAHEEGRLIAMTIEMLVHGTFEADWKVLNVKRKRETVLEGLYRGACTAPRDNSRESCPEMTIDGLAGEGEYNLIQLLKRLIAHDPTGNGRVKSILLFQHPFVDHQMRCSEGAPDLLKAFLYNATLHRNAYIVATLIGIVDAYCNRPFVPIKPAKLSRPCHHDSDTKKQFREGKKKFGKVDESQCKEEAAIAHYACASCLMETDRAHLKQCGCCKQVWYCSVACQKKDWVDHKKFCGKQTFDPDLLAPTPEAPDEFIGCPATVPGYIRTPALWQQIKYLSKRIHKPRITMSFDVGPQRTRSVQIFDLCACCTRIVFLVARRRAMASGSLAAVYKMLAILEDQHALGLYNLTLAQIRGQFEGEYRMTVSAAGRNAAGPFAPPTREELEEERAYLAQRLPRAPVQPEGPYYC